MDFAGLLHDLIDETRSRQAFDELWRDSAHVAVDAFTCAHPLPEPPPPTVSDRPKGKT